jgi:hypothetical protein
VENYLKHFKQYLLGRKFLVRTDHATLRWLRTTPEPIGQQARCLERIEEYDFDIQHRPGRKHGNADVMSRRPCRSLGCCTRFTEETSAIDDVIQPTKETLASQVQVAAVQLTEVDWTPAVLATVQATDPELKRLYSWITQEGNGRLQEPDDPDGECVTDSYLEQKERLKLLDGVMYRTFRNFNGRPDTWQLLPPRIYREQLIRLAHTGMTGHLGLRRTRAQVQSRAY